LEPLRECERRTHTQSLTVNPEWRETFTLPVRRPAEAQWLRLEVWDADERPFPDEYLGSVDLPLRDVLHKRERRAAAPPAPAVAGKPPRRRR